VCILYFNCHLSTSCSNVWVLQGHCFKHEGWAYGSGGKCKETKVDFIIIHANDDTRTEICTSFSLRYVQSATCHLWTINRYAWLKGQPTATGDPIQDKVGQVLLWGYSGVSSKMKVKFPQAKQEKWEETLGIVIINHTVQIQPITTYIAVLPFQVSLNSQDTLIFVHIFCAS